MEKKFLLFGLLFSCLGVFAQTPFEAVYDLSGNNNDTDTLAYKGAVCEGITPDSLLKVGVTSISSTGNFRANDWAQGATDGSDEFMGNVDLGKYIEFSVKANEGYMFTIDSIHFGIGRSTTGPRQWQWRGNVDEFSEPFTDYSIKQTNIRTTVDNGVITTEDVDVTTIPKNILRVGGGYANIANSATFRLYGFNSEQKTQGTGGLQGNLTVYGSYMEIPSTQLSKEFLTEDIKIYPNPAKNYVNVKTKDKIEIINVLGKQILETTSTLINVENLERGIYFVKVGKIVKPLIIN